MRGRLFCAVIGYFGMFAGMMACDPTSGDGKDSGATTAGDTDGGDDTDLSDDTNDTHETAEETGDTGEDTSVEERPKPRGKVKAFGRMQLGGSRVVASSGLGAGLNTTQVAEMLVVDLVDDEELLDLVQMEIQERDWVPSPGGIRATGSMVADGSVHDLTFVEVNANVAASADIDGVPGDGASLKVLATAEDGTVVIDASGAWSAWGRVRWEVTEQLSDVVIQQWDILPNEGGGASVVLGFAGLDSRNIANVKVFVDAFEADGSMDSLSSIWWAGSATTLSNDVVTLKGVTSSEDGSNEDTAQADLTFGVQDNAGGQVTVPATTDGRTKLYFDSSDKYDISDIRAPFDGLATLVSQDHTWEDVPPTQASVVWEEGESWTVPVHDVQAVGSVTFAVDHDPRGEQWTLTIGKSSFAFEVVEGQPVVLDGKGAASFGWGATTQTLGLVLWESDPNKWTLTLSPFGVSRDVLPKTGTYSLRDQEGTWIAGEQRDGDGLGNIAFSTLSYVFAMPFTLAQPPSRLSAEDPTVLAAAVTVSHIPEDGGEAKILVESTIRGVLGADDDGDVVLRVGDQGDATVARGDILIGGEPIGIERSTGGGGVMTVPPTIQCANGRGNRNISAGAQQTQQRELL